MLISCTVRGTQGTFGGLYMDWGRKDIGITLETMTTKMEEGIHRKTNTTKVKMILTRNHGKTGTKNCGTKIIRNNMVTRSPNPKMLALPLLKMLSIFSPQILFDKGIFNAVTK